MSWYTLVTLVNTTPDYITFSYPFKHL